MSDQACCCGCSGVGKVKGRTCAACGGKGRIDLRETWPPRKTEQISLFADAVKK